ncbi:hypothetical protein U8607_21760 [Methylobacterium durans]|uniref:hypothetical protein n=1 Tax=Methylobacterium durans TaxID=2202825 RepID=UPI002AFE3635|nr:hypothetical protein [Methylobacterium durans]MEA1834725.1 hypothetical protein [Methylobacterium durans]
MAHDNRTGNARSISMSDFNARAKRIAEQTGAVEKPEKASFNKPRRSLVRSEPQQAAAQPEPSEDGAAA